MRQDYNRAAYPEPPTQTPVTISQSVIPNPVPYYMKMVYYVVDRPVTFFKETMDKFRSEAAPYYHQKFRRVPDITKCRLGDNVCIYEAEMQWRRDFKVDQEILKIMQARVLFCKRREGNSYEENCKKVIEDYEKACAGYRSRYHDIGGFGSARKCLMKQKERMLKERDEA
ncbi:hypothetical protein DNTS_003907 [Danionella cerebrum]|uniref:NADH dehydrogenase [ubiquinone] 1 beta subcomplex subunit 10 n=1 Tax=Danionella cerebrum TaxID=2873325 RepID=A0A553Q417_9TELE|nr:hypothetical protein DNTS_003907 [Danionella translucida]